MSSGPHDFTQITKILFKYLKDRGHLNSNYLDDSFLCAQKYDDCLNNILDTLITVRKAGFIVHPEKSVFVPTQVMEFLGFVLNTINMTVRLTPANVTKIQLIIEQVLSKRDITIQELSELIGTLVSTFPGVTYGKLYYRQLENEKSIALKYAKSDANQR